MGPRCSSAETQVCHRSYIIAAIPAPEIRPTLTVQDIRPALPNQESGPALPGSEISPFIDVTEGEYTCKKFILYSPLASWRAEIPHPVFVM